MEIVILVFTHVIALSIGVVVGVHNSQSSTVKPLAEKAQKVGKKALSAAKKRLS
jgi:hypothetical protein